MRCWGGPCPGSAVWTTPRLLRERRRQSRVWSCFLQVNQGGRGDAARRRDPTHEPVERSRTERRTPNIITCVMTMMQGAVIPNALTVTGIRSKPNNASIRPAGAARGAASQRPSVGCRSVQASVVQTTNPRCTQLSNDLLIGQSVGQDSVQVSVTGMRCASSTLLPPLIPGGDHPPGKISTASVIQT